MAHIFFEKLENRRSTQVLLPSTPNLFGYPPTYYEASPYPYPAPYPSSSASLWNPIPLWNQPFNISPWYTPQMNQPLWNQPLNTSLWYTPQINQPLWNQPFNTSLWYTPQMNQPLWNQPFNISPWYQWPPSSMWSQSPLYSNPNTPTYYYAYGVGFPIGTSSGTGILF